jgi:uncharacterized protein YciI
MFLIDVSYTVPIGEIDRLAPAHRVFAATQYAAGKYLMSGRKLPRTGGFILAAVDSRQELDAIIALDPFHQAGVATYAISEVQIVMARADLEHLLP